MVMEWTGEDSPRVMHHKSFSIPFCCGHLLEDSLLEVKEVITEDTTEEDDKSQTLYATVTLKHSSWG